MQASWAPDGLAITHSWGRTQARAVWQYAEQVAPWGPELTVPPQAKGSAARARRRSADALGRSDMVMTSKERGDAASPRPGKVDTRRSRGGVETPTANLRGPKRGGDGAMAERAGRCAPGAKASWRRLLRSEARAALAPPDPRVREA